MLHASDVSPAPIRGSAPRDDPWLSLEAGAKHAGNVHPVTLRRAASAPASVIMICRSRRSRTLGDGCSSCSAPNASAIGTEIAGRLLVR
jgi:hypothetical protein